MDSTQEQQLKRKLGGTQTATTPRTADVFDQMGNDLLLTHVAEAKNAEPELAASSLLSTLLEGPQVVQEEEQQIVRPEEIDQVQPVQDRKQAEVIADRMGVDAVLVMDPKALGTSELAKEEALGEEGEEQLHDEMKAAAASLGAVELGGAAESMVADQVREQLDVQDIVEARREDRMDELVEDALRTNALRSRDEVILLLQRLSTTESELQTVVAGGDPSGMAIQLVEYLSTMLVEFDDLYALAAYDHGDILKRVVLSDDALNVDRKLSPLALKMGGFSAVLYQMVLDEMAMHPLQDVSELPQEEQDHARAEAMKPRLLDLTNFLRLARATSV